MEIEQQLIGEIVRRIVAAVRPQRIILFGSAATGQMTPDSDIDLLILKAAPVGPLGESVRVRQALRGLSHPFDVIVMALDWYEDSKDVVGGLAYPTSGQGRVIYDAA